MKARVHLGYTRQYAAPIVLRAGEKVRITRQDLWEERYLWLWCVGERGEGWVPDAFLEVSGDEATALRDYDAVELSADTGETLTILETVNGWHWAMNQHHQQGWIPVSHVTIT
jgi:hypothetical protein